MLTLDKALDRLREDLWEGLEPSLLGPLASSSARRRMENMACASVRTRVSKTPREKTDNCGVSVGRMHVEFKVEGDSRPRPALPRYFTREHKEVRSTNHHRCHPHRKSLSMFTVPAVSSGWVVCADSLEPHEEPLRSLRPRGRGHLLVP